MNHIRLTPIVALLLCIGCETLNNWNNVHHSQKRDKIFSLHRDAYIKPFFECGLDTQGYVAVNKVHGIPDNLATAQGEVITSRSVEPAPMIDLRFAKAGIETRLVDRLRLDVYADAAFLWGYVLDGSIETNSSSAPPQRTGGTTPGYTSGFAPAVIPGINAELLYFFGEKHQVHAILGARYREFDLRVIRGGWFWTEGIDFTSGGKGFESDSKVTIADIYEKSFYIGIGKTNIVGEKGDEKTGILAICTLRLGLVFNDIRVKHEWKDSIVIDYYRPTAFAGLDIGFRF